MRQPVVLETILDIGHEGQQVWRHQERIPGQQWQHGDCEHCKVLMCAWRFCVISSRVCMEIVGFKFPYTYECACQTHASSLCASACEVVHGSHGSRTEIHEIHVCVMKQCSWCIELVTSFLFFFLHDFQHFFRK